VSGLPLATPELVRRLELAAVEATLEWVEGLADVRVERFGDGYAAVNPALPEVDFMNTVMGLSPGDAGQVEAIAARYAADDVHPWFELAPADDAQPLYEALVGIGGRLIGFYTVLYGRPERHDPGTRIRAARPDEAQAFGEVLLRGHGAPEDAEVRHVVRWAELPGMEMFVAEVDGRLAAAGALAVASGIGYLASASTLPEFRGRGLQRGLILARVDAAARAGCELVSSQAAFASGSQRNLQRAGLQIAYTKTVWRVGGDGGGP